MKPLVVFVVGPTATGKSEFALEAAKEFGGEIINTDSVQVYENVEIGTAKPPAHYFEEVPHHLYGYVKEGETSTAGQYREAALGIIKKTDGPNLFFATGGSGFYVQALEKGMYPTPEVPQFVREAIDAEEKRSGLAALFDELKRRDPEYAAEISTNDTYRIKRALEINRYLQDEDTQFVDRTWTAIKKRFEIEQEAERPFRVVKIGLMRPRAEIRKSVEARTSVMLANGWREEVIRFREKGLSTWAPLLSVGYREMQEHLDGQISWEELPGAITTSTMQLVKRQTTWFRRDSEIQWFDPKEGWSKPIDFLRRLC